MKKYRTLLLTIIMLMAFCTAVCAENSLHFDTSNDSTIFSNTETSSVGSSSGGGGSGGGNSSSSSGSVSVSYKDYRFHGTVSLPDNEKAEDDIDITVTVYGSSESDNIPSLMSLEGNDSPSSGGSSGGGSSGAWNPGSSSSGPISIRPGIKLTIPKGKNGVSYSCEWSLPENCAYAYIKAVTESNKYLQTSKSSYVLLDESEINILNVMLEKPDCYISGCFTLGEGSDVLNSDLPVWIYLKDASSEYNKHEYSYCITLKSGTTSTQFSIPARYGEYKLSYKAVADEVFFQHISDEEIYLDSIISANADVNNIECQCQYNNVVNGVICLPKGITAPDNGVKIGISGGRETSVIIPAGENSVSYAVQESEYIVFTQVDANDYDIHYENIEVDKENANIIELVPYYTVAGEIKFSEPVDEDASIYIRIGSSEKNIYRRTNVNSQKGDISAKYFLSLPEGIEDGDVLDIEFKRYDSQKYIMTEIINNDAVKVNQYASKYNFEVQLKKKAELVKGTIKLQNYSPETSISFYLKNDSNLLYGECVKGEDSDKAEFAIYGESENISEYNGSYELSVAAGDYTDYKLYYNNSDVLSFTGNGTIDIFDTTVVLNLEIPKANQMFCGTVNLPKACRSNMTIRLNLLEKESLELAGKRLFKIDAGQRILDFDIGFLCKNTDYIIEYKISGRDLYPYYNDYLPLYIGNGGADIEINNAKTFNIDGLKKEISLDFSPLLCSYIMGTVKLPDGIAPSENTYFQVKVTADGDSYNNYDYVRFDEGENENEYSIEIPQVYANLSYAVSCFVGDEADIPSPPVQTALKDTSFIMPESSSGGGGGGRPGNYKKRVIPSDVVQGIPKYFSTADATYDLGLAEKIKMADIDSYNADLTVGSISEKHPRTIGGYFCDIYGGTDATIQLCDSETNEVLDSVDVNETGNYAFYELNTDTLNGVYIRYLYDEKERFYSNASNLTDSIDEAMIIPTASEAVKYGYDVYKDNTKYKNFNDRYFEYEIIGFDYPYGELHFSLFDKMGNKIESVEGGRVGRFTTSVCNVLIGFEFGGKTYYFNEKPTYTRYKEPALKSFSENINSAFMYRLPHSSYRVFVTIDLSDFISGQLLDKNGKSIVNESYFNYSDESNGIYVSEMYIDVNDEVFQSGGTVYVGIYDKTGRLLGLRAITTHPQNNTVPIDEILPNGGYIKIMPWGKNINPLSNADKFFD